MKYVNGSTLAQMFTYGAANLEKHVNVVDALNVFPVPDGDTGTNMNLTMTAGAKEVKNAQPTEVSAVATAFAKGLLMGARGNSGVILSQLFRGFSKKIEGKTELTISDAAEALLAGVETAYKAVMKPVEGTILTVAKDAAKQAKKSAKKYDDFLPFMETIVKEAQTSLNRTPDLLPVLKEVGVVDSGGQGLVYIYEGFLAALKGEELPIKSVKAESKVEALVEGEHHHVQSFMSTEDIQYGFCTEVMIRRDEDTPFSEETFRNELHVFGDSLLVVSDEEYVKIHIHAEQPGEVLTLSQRYGELIKIKIENMREQHTHLLEETKAVNEREPETEEKSEFGIITVSMGDGIAKLFTGLGAGVVIPGGQTMNPSTEEIVKAIEDVHAKNILILPNNGNIVMAAEQAAEIAGDHVVVVPSKTIPQGLSAILAFNPAHSLKDNAREMTEAMSAVKTGQVTFAVRATTFGDLQIKEGDFIGIAEKEIISAGTDVVTVTKELCGKLLDDESEIVTLFQGKDRSNEETNELIEQLEAAYPEIEFEVHHGDQPLYSYIVSVE